MKRALFLALLVTSGLATSRDALALSCSEIMNLVDLNVPTNIIVDTMAQSGDRFSSDDVRCLTDEGAPQSVIEQAKKMTRTSAESEERDREPAPVQRSSRSSSDEDVIGSRSSRRKEVEDLGSEDTSSDPRRIQEAIKLLKAKKPLTASLMLYELLEDGTFPEQEGQIHYYLGRAFTMLEMYHAAQYHYIEVVRKGPSNRYFEYALPKLVSIARFTGDDTELMRIVAKIPPDAYPRNAQNHLFYLMGIRRYKEDNLSSARKYFAQISPKSELYLTSKYFEGVIYNQQGKLKSAVRAFRDVYRTPVEVYNDARQLQQVENLKDLALLNVARIYYGIERFDEADKYFGLVSRTSTYWPEAQFESAWASFMQNDLNMALGKILTIESPFFRYDEFIPEATILKGLTFFNLCEYNDVDRILLEFEDTYRKMHDEMKEFVKSYATQEGKALADQAWDSYFGPRRKETHLNKSVFNRILRNTDLAGLVRHMDMMAEEDALVDDQKAQWAGSVGEHVKQILEHDRERYKRRAGLLLLGEMARQTNYLSDLLTQSEIIRFEVLDAQRVDYQYKMQNPNLGDSKALEVDFATSVDYIYWPFNGEFWQDELGYYHYTEQGSCK